MDLNAIAMASSDEEDEEMAEAQGEGSSAFAAAEDFAHLLEEEAVGFCCVCMCIEGN
jgi:hypothetical protein